MVPGVEGSYQHVLARITLKGSQYVAIAEEGDVVDHIGNGIGRKPVEISLMPLLPIDNGAFHKSGGKSTVVGKPTAGREVLPGAQEQVFWLFLPFTEKKPIEWADLPRSI